MISAMDWLGSFPPDAPQPDAAFRADAQRALTAFPLFEQARRIAIALVHTRGVDGLDEKTGRLREKLNRLTDLDSGALDDIFELEIAGRFRERGMPIAFLAPDIVLMPESDHAISVACKRPRSLATIRKNVKAAQRQIENYPRPGLMVIGLEAVLQRNDESRRPIVFTAPDPATFNHGIDGRLLGVRSEMQRCQLGASTIGVVGCGVVTAWSSTPSAYLWRWAYTSLPNIAEADAAELLDALERLLFPQPYVAGGT